MSLRPLLVLLPAALLGSLLRAGEDAPLPPGLYAEFTTPRGVIVAELFYRKTPLTAASFVGLAEGPLNPKSDAPFFDGLKFHRVVPNFVVQGGDPLGTGEGDPGYQFADEFVPGLRHDTAGILSMANSGPDTNGSQFFFTLRAVNSLNYLHTVFGRVVRGLAVLPQIQPDDTMTVKILRLGAAAQSFRVDLASFSAMRHAAVRYTAAPEPGPQAHFDDPAALLPVDPPRARNFNFKLANFERATGLKIVARLFARSPSATEDAHPGAFMRALATRLGVAQRGVCAAYFADGDEWRMWIGDDLTSAFLGRTATARDLAEGGPLHAQKEAFLAAVKAQAAALAAEAQQGQPTGPPLPAGQRVKYSVDAMLDALIFQFEPTAKVLP